MDDDETAELRNPFPSPPSHYLNYTAQNLKLLSLLRERAGPDEQDLTNVNQHAVLSDQVDVPDWPLSQLEKPRVDWILEDGQYTVFGDTWMVHLLLASQYAMLMSVDQGNYSVSRRARWTSAIPRRLWNW